MNNIGETIKAIRKHRNLTQKDLAKLINKSEITVRKYESGQITLNTDTLHKIANALDINHIELLKLATNALSSKSTEIIKNINGDLKFKTYSEISETTLNQELESAIKENQASIKLKEYIKYIAELDNIELSNFDTDMLFHVIAPSVQQLTRTLITTIVTNDIKKE